MALLSAREAARLLGVSHDTTTRRAKAAIARGDPRVKRIGNQFAADEAFWREVIHPPLSRGRPPTEPI
jgi:hypothetical protein